MNDSNDDVTQPQDDLPEPGREGETVSFWLAVKIVSTYEEKGVSWFSSVWMTFLATVFSAVLAGYAAVADPKFVNPVSVLAGINMLVFDYRFLRHLDIILMQGQPSRSWASSAVEPERKMLVVLGLLLTFSIASSVLDPNSTPELPQGIESILIPLLLIWPVIDVFSSNASKWQKYRTGQDPDD